MPFRKIFFWSHLVTGLSVGLVVLVMSATGVVLTYQKQMTEWADHEHWAPPRNADATAAPSQLVRAAEAYAGETNTEESSVGSLRFYSDPTAPVAASIGGGRVVYLDPSDATVRGENDLRLRSFFSVVTGIHRWFGLSGDGRSLARGITGWSNLLFLFLILSGLYLWIPRRRSWQHVRAVLLFKRGAAGKARDFNWHHVVGFWTSLPLALVVASATVISFPWASRMVIQLGGDEVATPDVATPDVATPAAAPDPVPFELVYLDDVLAPVLSRTEGWRTLELSLPDAGSIVPVTVDEGWGGQPQKRRSLRVDATDGREVSVATFGDQSRGRRIRSFLRFAHTGEYFGVVGQTVAGLVTLLSLILVWTGFALSWRRLVRPLLRKRDSRAAAETAGA